MKIIQTGFLIAVVLFSTKIFAQSEIEAFVQEGIQYHDSGDYEKAIETYQKALKLNPKSTLVNYEIALSYFTKGDYKEAVKYSDIVLKQNKDYLLPAYITKGSSLDMLAKPKNRSNYLKKPLRKRMDITCSIIIWA